MLREKEEKQKKVDVLGETVDYAMVVANSNVGSAGILSQDFYATLEKSEM